MTEQIVNIEPFVIRLYIFLCVSPNPPLSLPSFSFFNLFSTEFLYWRDDNRSLYFDLRYNIPKKKRGFGRLISVIFLRTPTWSVTHFSVDVSPSTCHHIPYIFPRNEGLGNIRGVTRGSIFRVLGQDRPSNRTYCYPLLLRLLYLFRKLGFENCYRRKVERVIKFFHWRFSPILLSTMIRWLRDCLPNFVEVKCPFILSLGKWFEILSLVFLCLGLWPLRVYRFHMSLSFDCCIKHRCTGNCTTTLSYICTFDRIINSFYSIFCRSIIELKQKF